MYIVILEDGTRFSTWDYEQAQAWLKIYRNSRLMR